MPKGVLVIGGGIAGIQASLDLAEKGFNVLLLDKEKFPRDKPCGGGVPVKILLSKRILDTPFGRYILNTGVTNVFLGMFSLLFLSLISDFQIQLWLPRLPDPIEPAIGRPMISSL